MASITVLTDELLLGYTNEQWMYVSAWYKERYGAIECFNDLLDAQMKYMEHYTQEPLTVVFEGIEYPKDTSILRVIHEIKRRHP